MMHDKIEAFFKKGCDEYEANKKSKSYRCWSKEFLCAAKEVVRKTFDSHKMKQSYVHQRWYRWFEKVGDHQADDRDQEINWITKILWNDPRLLYWAKTDLKDIGKDMFDRIFFYIAKNNINSLQLVFDHYKSSGAMDFMKKQCTKVYE